MIGFVGWVVALVLLVAFLSTWLSLPWLIVIVLLAVLVGVIVWASHIEVMR